MHQTAIKVPFSYSKNGEKHFDNSETTFKPQVNVPYFFDKNNNLPHFFFQINQ